MISKKKRLKVAIDSPAAAGAGTLAKKISNHYNLYYLDTGKIYRYIAYLKIKYPKKFKNSFVKKQIRKLNMKKLKKKELISNQVGLEASIIFFIFKKQDLLDNFVVFINTESLVFLSGAIFRL